MLSQLEQLMGLPKHPRQDRAHSSHRLPNAPQQSVGADLPVSAVVEGQSAAIRGVTLVYRVNYGSESSLPMAATPAISNGYGAVIPAAAFKAGDLVRWYVQASDSGGNLSRAPPANSSKDGRLYYGTVIRDPSVSGSLPIMYWFTNEPTRSTTQDGANGSAVYFLDRFYDNLFVKRKGVTSLSWPKPKLKFSMNTAEFVLREPPQSLNELPVKKFELNSIWWEPGQMSYMREYTGYEVMRQLGIPTPIYYYIVVYQNGQYYGLHTLVEVPDSRWLKRVGLDPNSILIESKSGDLGNLRWDVSEDQLQYYYDLKESTADNVTVYSHLSGLTRGIAGAGALPRSRWPFDFLDLPEVINYMAAATMLLYQDRCTKNWYIYQDNSTGTWSLLPHDLKTSLGADRGLHGTPAPDYCILECEQWNSPLYCDRNHPQDLPASKESPWNSITTQSLTGRRLLQQLLPAPSGAAYVDENLTQEGPTKTGAAGTFNYLIDIILTVPATRVAYLRRLRSVTDQFHGSGRLLQIVTDTYNLIRAEAKRDNQKWNAGDIDMGYEQLMTEQIPIRKDQLLGMYGPTGTTPLLPDSQPTDPGLVFGRLDSASPAPQQFVEVVNPTQAAVDVSGWKLAGTSSNPLRPGTVIPPLGRLILTPDLNGFGQRSNSPTRGQGLLVQAALAGPLPSSAASLTLLDGSGNTVVAPSAGISSSVAG
eukprot:jgi/Botrbrau1/2785/Bobra.0164s0062.1